MAHTEVVLAADTSDNCADRSYVQYALVDRAVPMVCTPDPPDGRTRLVVVALGAADGGVGAGTYTIGGSPAGPNGGASVFYGDLTSVDGGVLTTPPPVQLHASAGTVTLTAVDIAGDNTGSFDVTLMDADGGTQPMTGTFEARQWCTSH